MRRTINIALSLTSLFLAFAFAPAANTLFGLYGECESDGYYSCEQLELKEDSTFVFYQFFDVGGEHRYNGTWKVNEDTLVLNTFHQPKFPNKHVTLDSSVDWSTIIQLYDTNGDPTYWLPVVINNTDTLSPNQAGNVTYSTEINSIELFHMNVGGSETFMFNSFRGSEITIYMEYNPCLLPEYLTNYKFIIDQRELRPFLTCLDSFADYGLQKTVISNKVFE